MSILDQYKRIVSTKEIEVIRELGKKIKNKRILIVNSTKIGGGVAELLKSKVTLLNDLEIKAEWKVIPKDDKFFNITKKIHNNLQGGNEKISEEDWDYYLKVNEKFAKTIKEEEYDLVIIHDPQPLATILFVKKC